MLELLRVEAAVEDYREAILNRLMEDFLDQLLKLVPDEDALE
jgi:hypothetical protein